MSEQALDPIEVDATFTSHGVLRLSDDSVAKVAEQLGHEPRPGDVVHLAVRRSERAKTKTTRPGERGALAHLAHLAQDLDADAVRTVREEMTAESEWAR